LSPEATFFQALASGQIPFGAGLLTLIALVLWKGSGRMEKLTVAVEALPAALTAHRDATVAGAVEIKAHVTAQTERVLEAFEDKRLAKIEAGLDDVKRAGSNPGADAEPPATRRGASGMRTAVR
jgi:tripartite-type tricarboxylate transporter receptor subunit TctC